MSEEEFPELSPLERFLRDSANYLRIIDQNNLKVVLKVGGVPTIEIQLEDEGSVIALDVVDPERVGSLIQQFGVLG